MGKVSCCRARKIGKNIPGHLFMAEAFPSPKVPHHLSCRQRGHLKKFGVLRAHPLSTNTFGVFTRARTTQTLYFCTTALPCSKVIYRESGFLLFPHKLSVLNSEIRNSSSFLDRAENRETILKVITEGMPLQQPRGEALYSWDNAAWNVLE